MTTKTQFIATLQHASDELRGTIRNWRPKYDLSESIGPFKRQFDGVIASLESSDDPLVATETAKVVWELSSATDNAAKGVDPEVAGDVKIITQAIRHFYFARNAVVDHDNRYAFLGTR